MSSNWQMLQKEQQFTANEDMSNRSAADLVLLRRLFRSALRQGALSVQYQAQWNLRTGSLVGLEALARWQHHQLGWIPPSVFVPIAEIDEAICVLGNLVLRRVLTDINQWDAAGFYIPRVALNVSPHELQPYFAERTLAAVGRASLQPSRIQFEITESVQIADNSSCVSSLADLRSAGFSLALDDFGVGFSNLNALRYLPIQVMKLDRCFVKAGPEHRKEQHILKMMVALADSLGLETVAEGVESKSQIRLLHEVGCKVAQGYYLSSPVSCNEIPNAPVNVELMPSWV